MDTINQSDVSGLLPSDKQFEYLHALQVKGAVLLQYQVLWDIDEDRDVLRERLIDAIHELSGRILSIAAVDLLTIGENPSSYDEILLVEFPEISLVKAHMDSPETQEIFSALGGLELHMASSPPQRMWRIVKWVNRILPWFPAPRSGKVMPEDQLQGGINPSKAQFEAFQKANQKCTVHMFNLLKFHERAQYVDGDRGRSGRRAYEDGYGRVAMECVLRLKGRIIMLGRYRMTLVGADGDPATDAWDEIAVIQYPNRPAFIRMVKTPRYIRALEHRHAGLSKTEIWSTAPTVEYCQ